MTNMGGVVGGEIRFFPAAAKYVVGFFKELS